MDESAIFRILRQFRKVRGPDFHQPAIRGGRTKQLGCGDGAAPGDSDGGIAKRHPLSKEERAEVEKALTSCTPNSGAARGDAAKDGLASDETVGSEGEARAAQMDLVAAVDFFNTFDAWIDSKYPGDRGSATKVKVAFRKQHRALVANLCLEDIEDIAQAMQ